MNWHLTTGKWTAFAFATSTLEAALAWLVKVVATALTSFGAFGGTTITGRGLMERTNFHSDKFGVLDGRRVRENQFA